MLNRFNMSLLLKPNSENQLNLSKKADLYKN